MGYVLTHGFGDAPLSTTIESSIGTGLLAAAKIPSPASPFLAIAGGIADMLAAFGVGSGCGQTCVLSSDFANQASALLDQNIATYFGIPAPRPQSAQTAALANVQSIFNWVQQQCGNPQLGQAGQDCISQRLDPSACHWKATAPKYPGEPATGACWNWVLAYQTPIADDPAVPDAVSSQAPAASSSAAGSTIASSSPGATTSSPNTGLILAGLVAAVLLVWGLS